MMSFTHIPTRYKTINRKRRLVFEGETYPSVSSILAATKPEADRLALQRWRQRVGWAKAQAISGQACRRGTSIHQASNVFLQGQEVPSDVLDNPFWHSIRPILNKVERVHLTESAVYHAQDKYAGRFDCLGEWQGQLCVFDWKTSSKPKKLEWITDYCLQATAYITALNYLYQTEISQGLIAIALKEQPAQLFHLKQPELRYYGQKFQERLQLWRELDELA